MSVHSLGTDEQQLLERCDAVLATGDWRAATVAAQECLDASPGLPEALERYARAARWLDELDEAFAAREQAFAAYRERGDAASAARVASMLAFDNVIARREIAVANGWFARAHEQLEGVDAPGEVGWNAYREAQVARYIDHDLGHALALASEARLLARTAGDPVLDAAATALVGLIEVSLGDVDTGMTKLDKAGTAVLTGEVPLVEMAGVICCEVIFACEQLRDTERARDWLRAASRIGDQNDLTPLIGACQVHYATILMWEGDWPGAEQALDRAGRAWDISGRGFSGEHGVRLAQLRTIQGRYDDAWEICESLSWVAAAKLGQARIAFARGDVDHADALLERFFRACEGADRQTMSDAWALRVNVDIRRGELDAARAATEELRAIAEELQTAALRGAAALAAGQLSFAEGDLKAARVEVEDAIDFWMSARAPYEAANARLVLAEILSAGGDDLLADGERARAAALFDELASSADTNGEKDGPLTTREREVLALVADGLSDEEVAEQLVLSPHTVHRHVANIRLKLDQPTRTAAVAHAARTGLI